MISNDFNTKADLDRIIYSIDKFKLDLYTYSASELERCLHYQYDIKFNSIIQGLLAKNELDFRDEYKVKIEHLLDDLAKSLVSIEILDITIAFSPSARFLNVMRNWAYENITDNIVLDIHVDPAVLGGASLIYRGHYLDLTIANKLKNFDFTHI